MLAQNVDSDYFVITFILKLPRISLYFAFCANLRYCKEGYLLYFAVTSTFCL